MQSLDDIWLELLGEARLRALRSGRNAVAEYLELRSRNDQLRAASIGWLTDIFVVEATGGLLPVGPEIEREEPHRFEHLGASHSGILLCFRLGVRQMTLEAGWPRLPGDGILTGGSVAAGRLVHRGLPRLNRSLALVADDGRPEWIAIAGDGSRAAVDAAFVREQILLLAGG